MRSGIVVLSSSFAEVLIFSKIWQSIRANAEGDRRSIENRGPFRIKHSTDNKHHTRPKTVKSHDNFTLLCCSELRLESLSDLGCER